MTFNMSESDFSEEKKCYFEKIDLGISFLAKKKCLIFLKFLKFDLSQRPPSSNILC